MPISIIVGAQWGDEGKGRFVDLLAREAEVVARFSGGDNAGHTVAVGDKLYKMHLIPSGILHEGVVAIMGNGMVINPLSLVAEIDRLREQGVNVTPDNLLISARAHLITPAHIELDKIRERASGAEAIGTTLRGIGPAYHDKVGRCGVRIGEMIQLEDFAYSLRQSLQHANQSLSLQGAAVDVEASVAAYTRAAERLQPFIYDTALYLNQRLSQGARVIAEGAQGTLLDVDHGSYPYVTSSSPTAGGALTGLGVGPRYVDRVLGIAKAFSTRVGGGPMPTEDHGVVGQRLRGTGENFWDEYGTTTGRPRRCGWLDLVMLRYAAVVNGFSELALTKLDVLSGFEQVGVCVAYEIDGERWETPPTSNAQLERANPIYDMLPGWSEDLSQARCLQDLPRAARAYVDYVAQACGVPITMVSVGPERSQLVVL
ncbi:MAG: adenylosuccinate synthase [Anaerolineae bacterium]|nr:adenylosuccinate synthase [Anaerolineae bacterium]MDW8173132.1 adenylosuccinate synthase [Anaerolineae bacterium]